jgi:hypothetical protein
MAPDNEANVSRWSCVPESRNVSVTVGRELRCALPTALPRLWVGASPAPPRVLVMGAGGKALGTNVPREGSLRDLHEPPDRAMRDTTTPTRE